MKSVPIAAALLALAACNTSPPPAEQASAEQPQAAPAEPAIAPTSDEAAVALVETYYDLLERKDIAGAARLWGDQAAPAPPNLAELHAEVGKPGPSEGACGSVYIEVPVKVRSRLVDGVSRLQTGKVTLRRVNNVDGATPAQLRWHITAIDMTPA